jgi:hypothetical protein
MATAKYFKGGPKDGMLITAFQQTSAAASEGGLFFVSNEFDATQLYSATAGGAAVLAGGGLTAADVAEVLSIGAGTHVLCVYATVLTAEGATQVLDIGDGATADGYFNDLDANAAAGTTSASLVTVTFSLATAGGKLYTSADTIDITAVTNNYNAGKIRLTAVCLAPVV